MSLCVDIHKSIKIELVIFFTYCVSLLFLIPMASSSVVPSRTHITTTPDTAVDITTTPDPIADIKTLVFNMMKEDPDAKYQLGVAKAGFILAPKISDLRKDNKNYAKVLRIIGTRSKVEDMVEKLYPLRKNPKTGEQIYGKPGLSNCDAIYEMLTSNDIRFTQDPFVCMLRQRLIDNNVPVSVFMKFIRWLYKQFSDKACHKMAQFSPPLPRYDNVKEIKEMLECIDIDQDVPALICVQIVLQPLDMPSTVSVDTTLSTSVLTSSNTSVSETPDTANGEE